MRSLAILAVALMGCGAISEGRAPTLQEAVDTGEFICDIRGAMKPAELSLADVVGAVDTACAQLENFQRAGILPTAPGPEQRQMCEVLSSTGASGTAGYIRLCGDELVTLTRQSITAFETAAVGVFPGYRVSKLITFNSPRTDAEVCGEQSITAISACGDEIFVRPAQFRSYDDPHAAAVYASGHEVSHVVQSQKGLLRDYAEHQAFRELQADCIFGSLAAELGANQGEVERGVKLLLSIGNLSTHGSASDRRGYALYGFEKGLDACLSLTPSSPLILKP